MFKRIFEITGNVAIVTGCSSGLGVQMANALANQGCKIVAIARRMDMLEQVCSDISKEHGVETLPVRCDITKTDEIEETVKMAIEKFGRVDILVNNAGTGSVDHAEKITDEQFQKEF
ncbi:MAG: SDR family NAD(P)-dependent oxidoreductase, partial [Lachnospiraceae bacterium]|nr:SDR family NAD(P)-dependent oxidoreductase [Lachnospiraceae bacterium]